MQEQNTKGIATAMCGNRATGTRYVHLAPRQCRAHLRHALLYDLLIAPCVRNKHARGIDIRTVTDAIGNIGLQYTGKLATVLFTNAHFALLYRDAGL